MDKANNSKIAANNSKIAAINSKIAILTEWLEVLDGEIHRAEAAEKHDRILALAYVHTILQRELAVVTAMAGE